MHSQMEHQHYNLYNAGMYFISVTFDGEDYVSRKSLYIHNYADTANCKSINPL